MTREQLKEMGFTEMVLGGANAQPYDWLHDSVFDKIVETAPEKQEYQNDFIGILGDIPDNLICRVQWNEYGYDSRVFITPMNNNRELLDSLFRRLTGGNDEQIDDNYVYTLLEREHLWSGPAAVTFWNRPIKVTFWKK